MGEFASLEELIAFRREEAVVFDRKAAFWELLAGFYPDNAHFIYELLQNAEDALATTVEFDLKESRLVVAHDGKRPFSLDDIASITDIGNSTKKDDDASIGKFGVGFKAVFSYTLRPVVRSGDYSFAIERRIVPEPVEAAPVGDKTVFTFPFNNPDKPKAQAYDEIARGLTALRETTVLFLRHVQTIKYRLSDGTRGRISRVDEDYPFVRIRHHAGDDAGESHWLRLVGDHTLSPIMREGQSVAAAFRLDNAPSGRKPAKGKQRGVSVVPLKRGDVCVYFPAVKESGGLRFHIHAPFASPPARDSINQDHSGNSALVEAIGQLIARSLPNLRDDGWLTDGLLEALPNADDQIVAPYTAIRDRVREAFWNEPLTPAIGGGYEAASTLVASPSEFRTALDTDDLKYLVSLWDEGYPTDPKWLPERRGLAQRFLAGLGVPEFSWEQLSELMWRFKDGEDDTAFPSWKRWLTRKPIDRVRALYELLGIAIDEGELGSRDLRGVPIIRLGSGRRSRLEVGSKSFLPGSPKDLDEGRIPLELAYFDNDRQTKAKSRLASFYQEAGVRRWDERAQVELRLAAYDEKKFPTSDSEHLEDVRLFAAYWRSHPEDVALLRNTWFLKVTDGDGNIRWAKPQSVFIDDPYRSTGLAALYGNTANHYRLVDIYAGQVEGFLDFVVDLGCQFALVPAKANIWSNKQLQYSWWAGSRQSDYSNFVDWQLPFEVQDIVLAGDSALLLTLWRFAATTSASYATAVFKLNNSMPTRRFASQLAQALTGEEWILDRRGDLRAPESMTVEELPDDWPEPEVNSLALAVGFGEEARQRDEAETERRERAEELGVPVELLNALDDVPEDQRQAIVDEFIHTIRAKTIFPSSQPVNPERRAAIVGADAEHAPAFETEIRQRSVVKGRGETSDLSKQYLRAEYTNDEHVMVCQACHDPMPFQHNGYWYFEAVQFIPKRVKTHFQNALALCPLCAALYTYKRETDDRALLSLLKSVDLSEGEGVVPLAIILNGKRVELWFTGKHALDLKTVLSVAGGGRKRGA